ncbi:unnamed protein product [Chilo suppressalis]|uniref:Uncharacterized protein n=1 Tax=Chilo suppressalis TaxID=168631 RepID=A0ABN8ATY5_CHISP|nr:unnamed protein product [Chilo suppressalis]
MSTIVPLIRGLRLALRSCVPLTDTGLHLQATLSEAITRRIGTLETTRVVAKAAFLDPRFKKTGFGRDDNANNGQQWVLDELTSFMRKNVTLKCYTHSATNSSSQYTTKQE